ncbi:RmlC-like cupin [Marasmius fiardii PR-910]|nr:RmlC-like cupin [Marasmius fiardii PR-910]
MPAPTRSRLLLLIALAPVYITLLFYLVSSNSQLLSYLSLSSFRLFKRLSTTFRPISMTTAPSSTMSSVQIVPRRNEERGHADHGWLKTFHTFSFAMYQDKGHDSYGCLRVVNEDRVAPKTGFGTHSHREFEIFSYVVEGELEHKDSMGNTEILKRGDLQLTSAGTGISHSEKTPQNATHPVHFLQIWSYPSVPGLLPKYFTRHFSDEEKKDRFIPVVAPVSAEGIHKDQREGEGPAPVQSPLTMYATLLSPGKIVSVGMKGKKGYVHVVMTSGYNTGRAKGASVKVAGKEVLKEGDGAYLMQEVGTEMVVENVGDSVAEVILFDISA